jgi:uncharacterized repeat protein (TIGR03803 family)
MQSSTFRQPRALATRFIAAALGLVTAVAAAQVAQAGSANANLTSVLGLASITSAGTAFRGDPLLASDGNFYLSTSSGGANALGAIVQVTPAGVGTVLYSFAGGDADSALPFAGLMQASDGNFYGTSYYGGPKSGGTVYRLTPAGVYTSLYTFTNESQGAYYPYAGLVQGPDGALYGSTLRGGTKDQGTVYRITTDGTYSVLFNFTGPDGANPEGTLIVGKDGALYGTTLIGGANNRGTVFKITTSGTLSTLYSFENLGAYSSAGVGTNTNGSNPRAGVTLGADGNFYGTTYQGGGSGFGTVFRLTSAGAITVLHSFAGAPYDGAGPLAAPSLDAAGNIYGTTERGGPASSGVAWRISPTGVYTMLHGFTGTDADGGTLYGKLVPLNGFLYGVSYTDTNSGGGILFRMQAAATGTTLPVRFDVSVPTLTLGSSATLSWSSPSAATCVASGAWTDTVATSGTLVVTPGTAGVYNYLLSCKDGAGVSRAAYTSIVVNAPPAESVDGGATTKGGGSLSTWSLLLLAGAAGALARRRYSNVSHP